MMRTNESPDLPSASRKSGQIGYLAPVCAQCHRRHERALNCWQGGYARRVSREVIRQKGALCQQCKREGRPRAAKTVDHIMPRSRGGTDELANLEPLCKRHNSAKGNRTSSPYDDVVIAGNGQPVSGRFR